MSAISTGLPGVGLPSYPSSSTLQDNQTRRTPTSNDHNQPTLGFYAYGEVATRESKRQVELAEDLKEKQAARKELLDKIAKEASNRKSQETQQREGLEEELGLDSKYEVESQASAEPAESLDQQTDPVDTSTTYNALAQNQPAQKSAESKTELKPAKVSAVSVDVFA